MDSVSRENVLANKPGSLTLLWNASSGWTDSDRVRDSVQTVLSQEGTVVTVAEVERGMDILAESKAIVAREPDVLVAAGGDGTINAAACALVHQPVALGVIPAGTLNHFARDLRIPIDPEEAARVLTRGGVTTVDVGEVNGRVFINNAVLGVFPEYREVRERFDAGGFGSTRAGRFLATVLALSKVLWQLPRLTLSYDAQGQKRTVQTPFVLIGNNEHRMEGIALGRRDRLDGGLLWVYVMRPLSRWRLFWLCLGVLMGRTPRESLFHIFSTPALTITSKRRQIGVGVDGEMVRMTPPLHFECLPQALRVLAPPPGGTDG